MNIETIKQKAKPILTNSNVIYAGVFGSTARGEAEEESDVDILVRFGKKVSLMDMGALQVDLSEALDSSVDLVTESSLHPRLKRAVFRDLQPIYER